MHSQNNCLIRDSFPSLITNSQLRKITK